MIIRQLYFTPGLAFFLCLLTSCGTPTDSDPCCLFTALPSASVADGEGVLQVQGSTGNRFLVLDEKGIQVADAPLNEKVPLKEGKYQISVNHSLYPLEMKSGMLVRCATGTLIISGNTTDNYYVMDVDGRVLANGALDGAMSFFPGTFRIKLNNTVTTVKVKRRELTEVKSGTLVVEGGTNEYYYVLDSANHQLAYNRMQKPLAFFQGRYPVKVNNTTALARIKPGVVTTLSTGSLIVKGATDEYYYVSDTTGHALNYQLLNKPVAFFPGKVKVKMNNTFVIADISARDTTAFLTGSVMLMGNGTAYYYVLDENGNELNYNSLNKSLSFFPGEYILKFGETMRATTISAGAVTTLHALSE